MNIVNGARARARDTRVILFNGKLHRLRFVNLGMPITRVSTETLEDGYSKRIRRSC